jgi:hypothetical protein
MKCWEVGENYTVKSFMICTLRQASLKLSSRGEYGGRVLLGRMGEKSNIYRLLVGKLERKRPLERPKLRWVANIKIDLAEIVRGCVDWIVMAQDGDSW